jgi:hypothetical protein
MVLAHRHADCWPRLAEPALEAIRRLQALGTAFSCMLRDVLLFRDREHVGVAD